MNDDLTLLREYAATNSEAAFAALVNHMSRNWPNIVIDCKRQSTG